MAQRGAARYAMFGLLYFSQGTILSYFTALSCTILAPLVWHWIRRRKTRRGPFRCLWLVVAHWASSSRAWLWA